MTTPSIAEVEARLLGLLRRAYPLLSHKRTCALVMRGERVRRAVENGWPVDDAMYHCNCDFHDLTATLDALLAQPSQPPETKP